MPVSTAVRSPYADPASSACCDDLPGGVGEVHDPGRLGAVLAAEDAVAEPEVERGAGDHDQVGATEGLPARLGDQQRVPARDDAAAHPVGDRRQTRGLHEVEGGLLGAVGPDVGAEDQHRAPGPGEQVGDGRDGVRVGVGAAGGRGVGQRTAARS